MHEINSFWTFLIIVCEKGKKNFNLFFLDYKSQVLIFSVSLRIFQNNVYINGNYPYSKPFYRKSNKRVMFGYVEHKTTKDYNIEKNINNIIIWLTLRWIENIIDFNRNNSWKKMLKNLNSWKISRQISIFFYTLETL